MANADHADGNAALVHLIKRVANRIIGFANFFFLIRRSLEHVFGRKLELVFGLRVLGLLRDELVLRLQVASRKANHRVDDRNVGRHSHCEFPLESATCRSLLSSI